MKSKKRIIKPASLWKRVFSYIIDLIVLNIIIIIPFRFALSEDVFINDFSSLINAPLELVLDTAIISIIIAILAVLYWAILEFYLNQSIGKMLFNIKVISLKGKLTFSQSIMRNITKVSTFFLLLDSIYFLNRKGMRFFDLMSYTRVVDK